MVLCAHLDKTLGLGQEAQRRVPRGFRTEWYKDFQLFETVPEVRSPETSQHKTIGQSIVPSKSRRSNRG